MAKGNASETYASAQETFKNTRGKKEIRFSDTCVIRTHAPEGNA